MIKKKKIDESLSLSGGIRNIILCFMCFRNHGQQFSEGEMRMKKGMLKGQRRELLFTVIFIMILTVSLNMIAFIWFQLRVYHMTFQQEFVDMKQKRILLYGDMENECRKTLFSGSDSSE